MASFRAKYFKDGRLFTEYISGNSPSQVLRQAESHEKACGRLVRILADERGNKGIVWERASRGWLQESYAYKGVFPKG